MTIELVLKLNKKYSEIAVDLEISQLLFYCTYGHSVQMLERR